MDPVKAGLRTSNPPANKLMQGVFPGASFDGSTHSWWAVVPCVHDQKADSLVWIQIRMVLWSTTVESGKFPIKTTSSARRTSSKGHRRLGIIKPSQLVRSINGKPPKRLLEILARLI